MILQRKTRCTIHDGEGGTCRRKDWCTRVVTQNLAGKDLHDHQVCKRHRLELDLPEHDVLINPLGTHRLLS